MNKEFSEILLGFRRTLKLIEKSEKRLLFLASLIIDFKIKPAAPQSIFREKLDWSWSEKFTKI